MFRFAGFHITLFDQDIGISAIIIFLASAVVLGLMGYYFLKRRRLQSASIRYSDLKIVKRSAKTGRQRFRFLLSVLRIMAIAFLIVAFARPQAGTENREVTSEGIDIMLALDISGSMRAEDFKPQNRLYVAKEEIMRFVSKRVSDRIGLVVFSQTSFTQCPLTLDYGILLNFLEQVKFGMIKDGTAIGMALAGLKPIAEAQFSGFSYLMLPQVEGHASRYRSRSQGLWTVPLVIRMPYGGGVRAMEHHSESREATYAHFPGMKVVIPSGPRNARALMVAAIRDPDPVVFMEPKHSYRAFKEEVPEAEEVMEIGKAQVVQEGSDLTVVSWGAMMRMALHAVEEAQEKFKVSIELIDLLTISPMDYKTITDSVQKTGRCVVVQEAPRSFGVSSEVIAHINDNSLMYLEAPVKRITGYDVVTPYFGRELNYIPNQSRVLRAIEETINF